MDAAIRRELGVDELRERFAEYTRAAYATLPSMGTQRLLELGCGRGSVTLRLAHLSSAEIVGIDIDDAALAELAQRIEADGLSQRVRILRCSLLASSFDDGCFGVLWGEGVVHIPGLDASLPECHRLLEPGGYLVLAEASGWMEPRLRHLARFGFELVEQLPWEPGCWWTRYGEPLGRRIRRVRAMDWGAEALAELAQHEADVDLIKSNIDSSDCAHYVLKKTPLP